jgi:hypothetical protein
VKLADLRKVAIRKSIRIRFALGEGLECVVNEHGVAQVPSLAGVPDFNLEDAAQAAHQFTLEPVARDKKRPTPPSRVTAEQLSAMAAAGGAEAPAHDEHDE